MTQNSSKKENPLMNLLINIVIPALILSKGDKYLSFSPVVILVIALALPAIYGLYDILIRKKTNFISILGFVSILISGVIGVWQLPTEYVAYKEASIPFLIGLAVFISGFTSFPVAKKMLYNSEVYNVERIEANLTVESAQKLDVVFKRASHYLALSFVFSAVLNFVLAKIMVVSPTGTDAFNAELGKLTAYSYVVIALPSMVLIGFVFWYTYKSIIKLSGLTKDEIFVQH